MPSMIGKSVSMVVLGLMVLGPMAAAINIIGANPLPASNEVQPMAGPRTVTLTRLTGSPPTINGVFSNANEWASAQTVNAGHSGYQVKLYLEADGTWLYMMIDEISDTDLSPNDLPPPFATKEYTFIMLDGNNDGKITYVKDSPNSSGISYGGKNADFGFVFWGDNEIWNSSVTLQGGNMIYFVTGFGGHSIAATGFGATPNSATPHRVHELKIGYDGNVDDLGCSKGYPYTKRFNLMSIKNNSNVATVIGQWPSNFVNSYSSFDTVTLPQKYPHILNVTSPKDGAVFQTGEKIWFEMNATDNNMSTLKKTVLLNSHSYDMGTSNAMTLSNLTSGTYNMVFKIQDDEGLSEWVNAGQITVFQPEVPPVIDSKSPNKASLTITEGQSLHFSVKWHDDNLVQYNESVTRTWTVNGKSANPTGITNFQVNQTYYISNMTYYADYYTKGTYIIKFQLSDIYFGGFPPVENTWVLTVLYTDRAPKITYIDPPTKNEVVITELWSKTFSIKESDPDNSPTQTQKLTVNWHVNGVEQTAYNNIDDFIFNANPPNFDLAGRYYIEVIVSDGNLSDYAAWNVTVLNVDRAPDLSKFDPMDYELTIDEGKSINFSFQANDPDGDRLTYSWSLNHIWQYTGIGNKSVYSFATAFLPTEGSDSSKGPYFININITDGNLSMEMGWKVIVKDVKRAPIAIIDEPNNGAAYMLGNPIRFRATSSSSPDGGTLLIFWDFGDGMTTMGASVVHNYTKKGPFKVTVSASTGSNSVKKSINITLMMPPVLTLDSMNCVPKSIKTGDQVLLSVRIKNTGDISSGPIKIFLYNDSIMPSHFLTQMTIDNVFPGVSANTSVLWTLDTPGTAVFVVMLENNTAYQITGSNSKKVTVDVKSGTSTGNGIDTMGGILAGLGVGVCAAILIAFYMMSRGKERRKKVRVKKEEPEPEPVKPPLIIQEEYTPTISTFMPHELAYPYQEPTVPYTVEYTSADDLSAPEEEPRPAQQMGVWSPAYEATEPVPVAPPPVIMPEEPTSATEYRPSLYPELVTEPVTEEKVAPRKVPTTEPPASKAAPSQAPVRQSVKKIKVIVRKLSVVQKPSAPKPVAAPSPEPVRMPISEPKAVLKKVHVPEPPAPEPESAPSQEPVSEEKVVPKRVTMAEASTLKMFDETVEEFDISEIFLIYNDGRLITYSTTKELYGINKDLIGSMLIAIQTFVKESFKADSGLNGFGFSNRKVILEGSRYLILAAVLEGVEPPALRDEMQAIVQKIEGMYSGIVEKWDGCTDYFKEVRKYIIPLFRLKGRYNIKVKEKNIKIKSGIEFYSGYVRLKVGVSNELDRQIRNVTVTLDYDNMLLRLSHIEPDYPRTGSSISLREIFGDEKKTVAVYFDPVICQESHIDGKVSFEYMDGTSDTVTMKRRPVDVVCPIFYTKSNVNVAMLKRLLDELKYKDSRIFGIRTRPTLKAMYKFAVESVEKHDVKFIREFKEVDPYNAESWFYGEVRETKEKIVIRIAARETEHFLDIFVATSNLGTMTGLLAELGAEVVRKVRETKILQKEVRASTDMDLKDEVVRSRSLLDKYAEAEIAEDEIELA